MNEPTPQDNFNTLIVFMETHPELTLGMDDIYDYACETPSCAWGWARTIPQLHGKVYEYSQLLETFGITPHQSDRIFAGFTGNVWKSSYVSSAEWVIEAKKVLAENKASLTTKEPPEQSSGDNAK